MESPYRTVSIGVTDVKPGKDSYLSRTSDPIKRHVSSSLSHMSPYHLTQSAPFKFSVKKVRADDTSNRYQISSAPILKKIKLENFPDSGGPSNGYLKASTSRLPSQVTMHHDEMEESDEQSDSSSFNHSQASIVSSPSTFDEFLSPSRLIFMKARAYYILKSADINPYDKFHSSGLFQIAPELTDAAANVNYFSDEILNQLMSKVLFIYPTITNVVSATAFVFWSRDELHLYKLPLKFQARHQNSKKPIIPGQEDYFKFWDTVFNFSRCNDRVIKLENAIKNFRYALVQPSALNLSFFNHLSSTGPLNSDEQLQL